MADDEGKTVEMPQALAEMIAASDASIAGLCRMDDAAKRRLAERARGVRGAEEMRRIAESVAKFR